MVLNLILIGIATASFACGYYEFKRISKFIKNRVYAHGKVIGFKEVNRDGYRAMVPIIRFPIGVSGTVDAIVGNFSDTGTLTLELEDPVTVIYDPLDPEKIVIDDEGKHVAWIGFCVVGALILIFLIVKFFV